MPETRDHSTPLEWAKATWSANPLELLVPAAAGLGLAQGALALLGLRSGHGIFLILCLMALGFSLARSLLFLYVLARAAEPPRLYPRDMAGLFAPLIAGIVLYGLIAPNLVLSGIFALVSLPHLLMLSYLAKRYAVVVPVREPLLRSGAMAARAALPLFAERGAYAVARIFRKTPVFRRP